jgi:transcriptional regulator with PAS, ATPase and Fis domain
MVEKALHQQELVRENLKLKDAVSELAPRGDIIGESPEMQRVMELVHSVAPTDTTIMIRGESGTGKELVARAIHAASPRKFFPIVTVNCGAMTETLLESELFGHERGAFTGAQYRRKGKVELADGGTLFLDEIGNIDMKTQMDLLRVIETKQFTRVGGTEVVLPTKTLSAQ